MFFPSASLLFRRQPTVTGPGFGAIDAKSWARSGHPVRLLSFKV
jgi:hypothetical protein